MRPIDGITALFEILRRQVNGTGEANRSTSSSRAPQLRVAEPVPLKTLESRLRSRLKGLPAGVLLSTETKRMVIGTLLTWELDERLQSESKFNALVGRVQRSIDTDERLRRKFERVIQELST